MHFGFKVSNNETKYKALFASFYLAKELGVRIVSQVLGDFQAREGNMSAYIQKAKELLGYLWSKN